MIEFNNLSQEEPFLIFEKKYKEALKAGQSNVEAAAVSSFNKKSNEVDCRFVNIKLISKNNFLFFTNYNSPKSIAFNTHNQVSAVFYWSSINFQVRIKAIIKRTSAEYNNTYFKKRSESKNALAISSNQSKKIESYEKVILNFKDIEESSNLKKCPDFWGGFSLTPYYFEFWEGHESRINKRNSFEIIDGNWNSFFLEP